MRNIAAILFAIVLGASTWIDGVADLPLMPQLIAVPAPPVVFDKPEGRIIQAGAEGFVPAADIRRFYETTLPQLGWKALGPLTWIRGGEKLTIELSTDRNHTTVRFTVAPERKAGERE